MDETERLKAAPPSTGGEYVCVPRIPTREMLGAWYAAKANTGRDGPAYHDLIAAAPTGYVPVKRELLKRGVDLLAAALKNLCDHKDELPVSYEILAELRALLSPAPKDEAK